MCLELGYYAFRVLRVGCKVSDFRSMVWVLGGLHWVI